MVRILLKQSMRIGPKGQIVIPKPIRDAERLYPGREVSVEWTEGNIRIEPSETEDFVEFCEQLSKQKPAIPIDHEHGYTGQLEERWKRAHRST